MGADRVSSFVWLLLGLVTMYGAVQLGIGTLHEPGSGFLALLAGGFISLVAVGIFLQSFLRWRGTPVNLKAIWAGANWHKSLTVAVVTLAFILGLETLGFFLTSFFVLLALFKWVEKLSWSKAIIIPVLTLAITYMVFNIFLKANLPRGVLGF